MRIYVWRAAIAQNVRKFALIFRWADVAIHGLTLHPRWPDDYRREILGRATTCVSMTCSLREQHGKI